MKVNGCKKFRQKIGRTKRPTMPMGKFKGHSQESIYNLHIYEETRAHIGKKKRINLYFIVIEVVWHDIENFQSPILIL